jgi:hypothetical protein
MLQFIKNNKYFSFSIGTGIYGFVRSFNGSYEHPNNVLGNRLILGLSNSLLYSIYAPYYQLKLLNRIDIKLTKKEASLYEDSYKDLCSFNWNTFF